MVGVSGSKSENYFASTLEEFVFINEGPATLYCENIKSIIIDNYNNTKYWYMHIDIQQFPYHTRFIWVK